MPKTPQQRIKHCTTAKITRNSFFTSMKRSAGVDADCLQCSNLVQVELTAARCENTNLERTLGNRRGLGTQQVHGAAQFTKELAF
eukprot:213816-Amphidinium_carterae.2